MTKQPDIADLWTSVRELNDKVDKVRGHVNVLATMNKELNREALVKTLQKKIGTSLANQRLWYYADKPRTIAELQRLGGIPEGSMNKTLSRLHGKGILDKNELSNPVRYYRDEVTQDLGLEKWVEAQHRAKGYTLTPEGAKSESGKAADDDTEENGE